uniref:Uncharacterized protein n=1 Tax=Leersia perrieri TaxID=77586 RepID=A0A0D9XM81_9ORYZ
MSVALLVFARRWIGGAVHGGLTVVYLLAAADLRAGRGSSDECGERLRKLYLDFSRRPWTNGGLEELDNAQGFPQAGERGDEPRAIEVVVSNSGQSLIEGIVVRAGTVRRKMFLASLLLQGPALQCAQPVDEEETVPRHTQCSNKLGR